MVAAAFVLWDGNHSRSFRAGKCQSCWSQCSRCERSNIHRVLKTQGKKIWVLLYKLKNLVLAVTAVGALKEK